MPIADLDTDQRHAASAIGAEIAVSAGAGSGKTRLLVARYLRLIHQDKVPMDSIAAITFTNKAANQMKARIAKRARELADEDRHNRKEWLTVAHNAHRAKVSTIHSFCSSILRRFPIEADIDPSFTVIDTVSDTELRRNVISELMSQRLAEGGDDTAFLLTVFGLPRFTGMLHELLGMRTKAVRFIDSVEQNDGLDEEAFAARYDSHLKTKLDGMIALLDGFHVLRPGDDSLTPVYDTVLKAFTEVRNALEVGDAVDCDRLATVAQSIVLRGGSAAKWGKETLTDLKATLKTCREFINSLESYYCLDRTIAPRAAALLMHDYRAAESLYRKWKHERGILDNDDLLIETWRLLRTRYDVCRRVSGSFRHILVDEFQDTDGLQMDILNMIAGNSAASLFTVGDPKQSIYRFRGADVTVFNSFIMGNHTIFVPLTTNYRSAPAVMAFVNAVFERLMGDEPAHPFEAAYRPMKTSRKDSLETPAVDITVVTGRSGDIRRHREATLIADRIAVLTGTATTGGGYELGQMAILLRTGTPVKIIEEVLLARGIPFVNRVGGKLAGSPEAYDIGNLLGWLVDPGNPALLMAVLMSPFFGHDTDTLYALRTAAGTAEAMPAVFQNLVADTPTNPALAELADTAAILGRLVATADRLPVRDLLENAFDETGYTLALLADPVEGDRSLAAVDLIIKTAVRFEYDGGTKRAFAELLRSGMPFTDEMAQMETTGNAVSIMTIHGAKGLEFEVVFLADVTGSGNRGGGLVFDNSLGPGFSLRDDRGGSRETVIRRHILDSDKKMEEAESKRLLYVAATRAKDRLWISGAPPAKNGDNGSGNWMTWLHHVLDLPRDGSADGMTNDLFSYTWDEEASGSTPSSVAERALAVCAAYDTARDNSNPDMPGPYVVIDRLTAPIAAIPASAAPESISVSRLLDLILPEHEGEYDGDRDSSDINSRITGYGGTGAIYGDLFHRVLERVAFDTPDRWFETARETVEALSETASYLDILNNDLSRFASSPLAKELADCTNIRREEPFALMIGDTMVRGKIDLMYDLDGQPILVDYKTGTMPDDCNPLMEKYRLQLALYALAVWRATDLLPRKLVLAFVSVDEYREFPVSRDLLENILRRLETLFIV